jgi:hypothetical protein
LHTRSFVFLKGAALKDPAKNFFVKKFLDFKKLLTAAKILLPQNDFCFLLLPRQTVVWRIQSF